MELVTISRARCMQARDNSASYCVARSCRRLINVTLPPGRRTNEPTSDGPRHDVRGAMASAEGPGQMMATRKDTTRPQDGYARGDRNRKDGQHLGAAKGIAQIARGIKETQ